MCGIAGIFARSPEKGKYLPDKVRTMVRSIGHRGPDGCGVWGGPQGDVVLGHARLAIIDLTDEGGQPMVSHSGNLVLTLNGEIYNYVEMRHELVRLGVCFRGTSDTEVLLAAMETWGIETAVKRANGMFALAVLDIGGRKLWLARDRVGKKPLYLYNDSGLLVFSSEIKGILAVPDVEVTISSQALSDYLSLGFVVGPDTIYHEIREVNPGTLVEVDLSTQTHRESAYWQFPNHTPLALSPAEIQAETERRLKDSIKLRLRSDVPVGVFLSGGIDSGLITAIAAQQVDQPLKTFTVSFGNAAFDEAKLARQVARRYGTEHQEIRLEPDLEDLLPKVVRAYDEPFADPSALPTFAISREAARQVKVVLNGEGSDELFGGYRRIYAMRILERLRVVIDRIPRGLYDSMLKRMPAPRKFRSAYSCLYRFARGAREDAYTRYLQWSTDGFGEDEKMQLLGEGLYTGIESTQWVLGERMAAYDGLKPLPGFMALDFMVGMADCLLPKIDIATMAHGLEGRSPFLDYRLVEWVAQVEKITLLSGLETKPVLRSLSRKYLPPAIVKAPKRGFEIPLVQWMKYDLYNMVRDVCTSKNSILYHFFEKRAVMNLLDRRFPLDDERWAKRMWLLFMLAAWGESVHENCLHHT